MPLQFKLKAIGNSVGLILPKEELARLGVGKGDVLTGVSTPNGIELRPYDPDFERQMEAARKIMHKRRAVLRELAK
jgi:putative addiction module antidote